MNGGHGSDDGSNWKAFDDCTSHSGGVWVFGDPFGLGIMEGLATGGICEIIPTKGVIPGNSRRLM